MGIIERLSKGDILDVECYRVGGVDLSPRRQGAETGGSLVGRGGPAKNANDANMGTEAECALNANSDFLKPDA